MSETKKPDSAAKQPKKLTPLPNLNNDFKSKIHGKSTDAPIAFRFTSTALDRMLSMYRTAKDDKSGDFPVFYHDGSLIFLKENLDAIKSGAVPVELLEGTVEEAEFTLFNLDFPLLQQVYQTMKQIERDTIVLEIKGNNSVNYNIGTFNLPGKLKDTSYELPYSKLDSIQSTVVLPVADLNKVLNISYNATESSHNALDNIFINGEYLVGGTKGLLYRTETLLKGLTETIGFNYKYYGDVAQFKGIVSGEMSITLGTSTIRGKEKKVLEFMSYDYRLVIPLSDLNEGDLATFNALLGQLSIDDVTDSVEIHATVKAITRSLNCMELALFGNKMSHKSSFEVKGSSVTVSATPLTNEVATDVMSCNVHHAEDTRVSLGNNYMFSALASFEADDNVVLAIPKQENAPRIKLYGKTKTGNTCSWLTATYEA